MPRDRLNYSGDKRFGELSSMSFGHDRQLEIWLALQRYTGLYEQQALLAWIGKSCDYMEAEQNLPKFKWNTKTRKEK